MKFIFRNLPNEIIYSILLYDEHFIMRKGEIISIIPKSDYRYTLLNYITYKLDFVTFFNGMTRYKYYFPNLYNYEGRRINNSDLIVITINENHKNIVFYSIWIGRQYPKSFLCNKEQNYFIENPNEYQWIYTEYNYTRR